MTAPRITTLVTLIEVGGGRLRAETGMGERVIADATPDEERAYAPLLYVDNGVRITIEPADAPPHGSPLDYLAELKGLLNQTLDAYAAEGDTDSRLRRCLSLANSAHLAILAERARR